VRFREIEQRLDLGAGQPFDAEEVAAGEGGGGIGH